jgi:hypothetical protein
LQLVEHRQQSANELHVVLFRQVLRINKIVVDQVLADLLVLSRALRQVFKNLNKGGQLAGSQLQLGHVLAQRLLEHCKIVGAGHAQRCLSGVV